MTEHDTVSNHTQSNGGIEQSGLGQSGSPNGTVDGIATETTDGDDKDKPDTADQTSLTSIIPKEIRQYSPLLVGKYGIQEKRAIWSGRWGMTDAAFEEKGITSAFEMKSQEEVCIRTCGNDVSTIHPVFSNGILSKSSQMEHPSIETIHPAYLGYKSDPSIRSAMPFDGKYSGYFHIQALKGKPQTVVEKDVEIRFISDLSHPTQFIVVGTGENRFGVFTLRGLLNKETNEMKLYKIYTPKKEKEVKRPIGRRGRGTSRVKTTTGLTVATTTTPPAALRKLANSPAPLSTVSVERTLPPTILAPSTATMAIPRSVTTPLSGAESPFSRGRSERKRMMPAHLREENALDHERVSPAIKKCHSILKSLLANPKAGPFLVPVDPIALGIPDYFKVIKEPMDLGSIRQNLEDGAYEDASIFVDHVRLVFENAMIYNAAHSQVHIFASKLSEEFERKIKNVKDKALERPSIGLNTSVFKLRRNKLEMGSISSKKVKGGRGSKGNTRRSSGTDDASSMILSLKEDIERLKATLEQLQPSVLTPKLLKAAPFRMEDLTEEELNEPMSLSEKARLSADIRQLPQDKINRVLQIIAESVPVANLASENDEVEIDINSFDTRCLRMLEGYVRENGIGRKRKRPTPKSGMNAPAAHRLKSAKVAAVNIRSRKEEVRNQLAAMDGGGDLSMEGNAEGDAETKRSGNASDSSSSSSDSSSDSSDSDSDSEVAAPLRSPVFTGSSSLSQVSDTSARAEGTKKGSPLKVENRGAWSMVGQKGSSSTSQSLMQPEENHSTSLWMSARSMEQMKQRKLEQKEKEQRDEMEATRRRLSEQREKEKEREREEMERRKQEEEVALRTAQEERLREVEHARSIQRAAERDKLVREDDIEEHHDHALNEDLETFSSSSFL